MKNISLLIIAIAIFVIANNCKSKVEPNENQQHEILEPNTVELSQEQIETAKIQLGKIEERFISSELKVSGHISVVPKNYATVCSAFGGYIKSTDLVQGSFVSKGQTLVTIENVAFIEMQQNYFETKAKYNYAEKEYNRQKDLLSGNVNSLKTFEQAEAEYKALKAQLNASIQKLALLNIDVSKFKEDNISGVLPLVSPISGYIKTVNVNLNKSVNPTDILFEIINTQNLTLELIVYEKDIQKFQSGAKLKFSIPDNSENEYSATIYQMGKILDKDKTITVYASIDKTDEKLVAGMFVNATIEVSSNNALTVPNEAIVQFDEKFFIFAFKEKKMEGEKEVTLYEVVEVNKGTENKAYTEIIFKNQFDFSTKQIVVKGAYTILSKYKNSGEMSC